MTGVGIQPGPASRRGIPGPCPPKWLFVPPKRKLCSPSEDCAPKKLTCLGLLECKSRPTLVFAAGIFNFCVLTLAFWHRSLVFGRKNPLNLWSSACSLDPAWDKFLEPPGPSRFHTNKLLVLPQNLFLSPQSRYSGAEPESNWFKKCLKVLTRSRLREKKLQS